MSCFCELARIVDRLRGEGGCAWDRAQTLLSLRPYLLEETYEVLEAIDRSDDTALKGELGDLLFEVVLLARITCERGAFDLSDVCSGICEKMIRRHPHVFDASHVPNPADASVTAWEARKAAERADGGSALDGVPEALPALLRAHRISEKAARVGFDWPDTGSVRRKVDEELAELDEAISTGDVAAVEDELGDVLFALVNLGRFVSVAGEDALRTATRKFERRFRLLEASVAAEGKTIHELDMDALEARWQDVKKRLGTP